MRKTLSPAGPTILTALALVLPPGCASKNAGADHPQKLDPAQAPAPVAAAVESRFPGAQVTALEREKEHGQVVYDYELRQNGRKFETDVRADGTILEVEKQLLTADVPDGVTRAVRAKFPHAVIKDVMEVNKVSGDRETLDHYEVTLVGGKGKERELTVSTDGHVKEEAKE